DRRGRVRPAHPHPAPGAGADGVHHHPRPGHPVRYLRPRGGDRRPEDRGDGHARRDRAPRPPLGAGLLQWPPRPRGTRGGRTRRRGALIEMETKANYVLIGTFTLLVAVGMLLFGLWAAKYSSDRNWQAYHVVFDEPVTGLSEGGPVQYNGISVGTVDSLPLAPQVPSRVVARIRVLAEVPVKVDT